MDKVYKVVVKNPTALDSSDPLALYKWQNQLSLDAKEWLEAHGASSYLRNIYQNSTNVVIVLTCGDTATMLKLALI